MDSATICVNADSVWGGSLSRVLHVTPETFSGVVLTVV